MQEVFDFVGCADPAHQVQWNIESKINAQYPNQTKGVEEFVSKQHKIFAESSYKSAITVSLISCAIVRRVTCGTLGAVPELRLAYVGPHEGKIPFFCAS